MRDFQRISTKLDKFRPSLTLALKALVQERHTAGMPVYDFGLGETKGELDAAIRELAQRQWRRPNGELTTVHGAAHAVLAEGGKTILDRIQEFLSNSGSAIE